MGCKLVNASPTAQMSLGDRASTANAPPCLDVGENVQPDPSQCMMVAVPNPAWPTTQTSDEESAATPYRTALLEGGLGLGT